MSDPTSVPALHIWRWDGRVDRGTYALAGIIGLAIKNNVDRHLARFLLPFSGAYFNYWQPLGKAARLNHLNSAERKFLLILLAWSSHELGRNNVVSPHHVACDLLELVVRLRVASHSHAGVTTHSPTVRN